MMKDDFAEFERAGWSDKDTAVSYATDFAQAAKQCVPAFLDAVDAAPNKTALDLCCGHGIVAVGLNERGASVTGLDFSPAMLDLARAALPDAKFVEGDAMATNFADGSFDIVTCGFGVPHVPEPPRLFSEAKRVLKAGGKFAYSVWCGPETSLAFRSVFSAIGAHGDKSIALPPGPGPHDYADLNIAETALAAAGFSDISSEVIESHWIVDDPSAPLDMFLRGTVRGNRLLSSQPPEKLAAIRDAVRERVVGQLGSDSPWRIPVPALVISATA